MISEDGRFAEISAQGWIFPAIAVLLANNSRLKI